MTHPDAMLDIAALDRAALEARLIVAERLAREAGAAILQVLDKARLESSSLNQTDKAHDEGPVTAADLAADAIIREGLAAAFPSDAIVTEETTPHGARVPAHAVCWFVDPVDGTKGLIEGTGEYAVMIGLAEHGVPTLGVVFKPHTGVLYRGARHMAGAERTGADGKTTPLPSPAAQTRAPLTLAVSRHHRTPLVAHLQTVLGDAGHDTALLSQGSVGLKIARVLEGDASAYVAGSTKIKMWDTCGPSAILAAAGGRMTNLAGAPLAYHGTVAHPGGLRAFGPRLPEAQARALTAAIHSFERA